MLGASRRRAAVRPTVPLVASLCTNAWLAYLLLARRAFDGVANCPAASTQPEASSQQQQPAPARWLTVAIMTVPRKEDYLTATLESFAHERPAPSMVLHNRVEVLILNNAAPDQPHEPFEKLRLRYAGDHLFHFEANAHKLPDARPGRHDEGDRNNPGYKVRQQTRDFVSLLRAAAGRAAEYLLTMEDDFLACPHLFSTLLYVADKAHATAGDWAAVRVAYGLAGVLLRGKDVPVLSEYMLARHEARPPDHLIVEWMGRETNRSRAYLDGRRNLAFKWNLLDHIGAVSSLRSSVSPSYPHCFEALQEPVLFAVEAFSAADCPHDDLWPCPPRPRTSAFGNRAAQQSPAGRDFKRTNRWPNMGVSRPAREAGGSVRARDR